VGRKIYVRPKAKAKVETKKLRSGQQTKEGRDRQREAMRKYWAKWRKEHGKEPVTHEEATEIVKEIFTPETQGDKPEDGPQSVFEAVVGIEKERVLSDECRNMFHSVGMKFGYALGKSFGDAMIEGIKRAQEVRRKGKFAGNADHAPTTLAT